MGLHISDHGDGEHEISHDEFRILLGRSARGLATDATLAGYVQELTAHGWIVRKPGGRGSPRYIFTPPPEVGKNSAPLPEVGKGDSSTHPPEGGRAFYPPPGGGQNVHVVVEGEEVVVGDGVARTRAKQPETYELDERIAPILEQPDDAGGFPLEGCRGALLDYLQARVPTDRQYAYVRTLQAWLAGGAGMPRGLLDFDDPAHLIATALNDLGTEDERTFKSGRGQVGVVANLRAKIEHLAKAVAKGVNGRAGGEKRAPAPARRGVFPEPERST